MARKLNMLSTLSHPLFILIFFNLAALSSAQLPEAAALVKLKASLTNNIGLSNWTDSAPPCTGDSTNWAGVVCQRGSVSGLLLTNMGLGGIIDVVALAQLPNLAALSFAGNVFAGPCPKLAGFLNLIAIDLSNNMFSGDIPKKEFEGMLGLMKLDLHNNHFSGRIPESLADLPRLTELMLQDNGFQGKIPPFQEGQLRNFSVANNSLSGEIPLGVSNFDPSAFGGNKGLCGAPLTVCQDDPHRLTVGTIIMVALLIAAASAALLVVLIILCRRRQPSQRPAPKDTVAALATVDLERVERGEAEAAAPLPPGQTHQRAKSEPNVSITFLREGRDIFDMTDLLRASAEILGSGVFGSSYKAAVTENQTVVVKRYRHMTNVSKQDFQEHMRRLGRVNHPNVLPLVGFYYRREEKLLVYDFVNNSSLAAHLHGNRSREGYKCPDWPTRLSIMKGVARGLLCLYNELPSLTAAHGHLKSSNVLLDASNKAALTDYGLVPIVNQEHAEQHMISYKSPEYKRTGRITKKTDVWSLGVLILEVLTGRLFPSNFLKEGDAAAWVESVAGDEEKGEEVFDAGMGREKESEGEMRKLLRIGYGCCRQEVEGRPDIKEVVQQIEEVREREDSENIINNDGDLVIVDSS